MRKKTQKQNLGMVDTSPKPVSKRAATASASIRFSPPAFNIFLEKGSPKGNVLETARIAGIMAAKATPALIPMCHPLELNKVNITFEIEKKKSLVNVFAEVNCWGRTGVEMEAMTAASVAALTIYDMMKWADKTIVIEDVKLLAKSGGATGDFKRPSGK